MTWWGVRGCVSVEIACWAPRSPHSAAASGPPSTIDPVACPPAATPPRLDKMGKPWLNSQSCV